MIPYKYFGMTDHKYTDNASVHDYGPKVVGYAYQKPEINEQRRKGERSMSLYDYEQGKKIEMCQYSFYGIIQAAMRQADTDNVEKLRSAFPEVWKELQERYHASGGFLNSDYVPTVVLESLEQD